MSKKEGLSVEGGDDFMPDDKDRAVDEFIVHVKKAKQEEEQEKMGSKQKEDFWRDREVLVSTGSEDMDKKLTLSLEKINSSYNFESLDVGLLSYYQTLRQGHGEMDMPPEILLAVEKKIGEFVSDFMQKWKGEYSVPEEMAHFIMSGQDVKNIEQFAKERGTKLDKLVADVLSRDYYYDQLRQKYFLEKNK